MKTDTAGLTQRLKSARLTVETTEARKRAARTAKERDECDGIIDRAYRSLRSVERDVAIERARVEFGERLNRASAEIQGDTE